MCLGEHLRVLRKCLQTKHLCHLLKLIEPIPAVERQLAGRIHREAVDPRVAAFIGDEEREGLPEDSAEEGKLPDRQSGGGKISHSSGKSPQPLSEGPACPRTLG